MRNAIPLTPDQVANLRSTESDWVRMTPAQEEFIRSTGPGMACMFYGDEIVRITAAQLESAMKAAFETAANAALKLINSPQGAQVELECEKPELGQSFIRVTAKDDLGNSSSGIGMIPDPRQH